MLYFETDTGFGDGVCCPSLSRRDEPIVRHITIQCPFSWMVQKGEDYCIIEEDESGVVLGGSVAACESLSYGLHPQRNPYVRPRRAIEKLKCPRTESITLIWKCKTHPSPHYYFFHPRASFNYGNKWFNNDTTIGGVRFNALTLYGESRSSRKLERTHTHPRRPEEVLPGRGLAGAIRFFHPPLSLLVNKSVGKSLCSAIIPGWVIHLQLMCQTRFPVIHQNTKNRNQWPWKPPSPFHPSSEIAQYGPESKISSEVFNLPMQKTNP